MEPFKVLIVDNDFLSFNTMKSIVDWKCLNCQLMECAPDGAQAAQIIKSQHPDIVISEIHIPHINGIELLKQTKSTYPEIVFIIMTEVQDFEIARQSLHYKALDYLIKSQIDTAVIQKAIESAKSEVLKQKRLFLPYIWEGYEYFNISKALKESIALLMTASYLPAPVLDVLQQHKVLDTYMLLAIQFLYPDYFTFDSSLQDYSRLYQWEQELIDELSQECFPNALMINPDSQDNMHTLLVIWGGDAADYTSMTNTFYHKLQASSINQTGISPCLLISDICSGKEDFACCGEQLRTLQNYFYLTGQELIHYSEIPSIQYCNLGLNGIAGNVKKEINSKNAAALSTLFNHAIERVRMENHDPAQAVWLCSELYFSICDTINDDTNENSNCIFFNPSVGYSYLRYLSTKKEVVHFLMTLDKELQTIIQPTTSHYDIVIDKAKKYVMDHITQRITLMEVAGHVYLSPGYLSSLFKKHCGESLVDFINRKKMERACELLSENAYFISQISDLLSFENAYYFTRVFKRYIGMTPSEYQDREKRKHMIAASDT